MRAVEKLRGRTGVVLDTMFFVYFFEDTARLADVCEQTLKGMASGLFGGVVTPITMAELFVKPLREKRSDIATRYRNALVGIPNLTFSKIDHEVGCMAGALRAKYNLPLPDMLQVATTLRTVRPTLITNDRVLKKVEETDVVLIEELA